MPLASPNKIYKRKKKKSSTLLSPNYQRISNKESLVTAHFPSPEPEVRCLPRQIHLSASLTFPFTLNIGQTELSSTSTSRPTSIHAISAKTFHTHTYTHSKRSFSKRRSCNGDFVKHSIKARCRQIYGGSVAAFPARKQPKFMPTAWIIRFPSPRNGFGTVRAPRSNSIVKRVGSRISVIWWRRKSSEVN